MMKFTGFSLHTKYFFKNSIIYLIPPYTNGLPGKHETTREFVKKNNEVEKLVI